MDLRDPKTAKLVLGAIFGAALLYLHFGTAVLPFSYRARAVKSGELSRQYETLTAANRRARAAAARLPRLQAEAERLEMRWQEAQQLLPEATEMDALLREISFWGQSSGVEFALFKPVSPVVYAYHTEHPIEIQVEGSYHEIAGLLREVASMRRIVTVRELEIEQIPAHEQSRHSARAGFAAVAYTLGGDPAVAAEGAAPGQATAAGRGRAQAGASRPSRGRSDE